MGGSKFRLLFVVPRVLFSTILKPALALGQPITKCTLATLVGMPFVCAPEHVVVEPGVVVKDAVEDALLHVDLVEPVLAGVSCEFLNPGVVCVCVCVGLPSLVFLSVTRKAASLTS